MNPTTYVVVSTTKNDDNTDRQGQPLTDKQGNPQLRRGLRLEGTDVDSSKWLNCYIPAGGALNPTRGDTVTGQINGNTFYIQGVISGGQPPAPSQRNSLPTSDLQRSKEQCMRGEAIQAAACVHTNAVSKEELFATADSLYRYIEGTQLAGSASPPGNSAPPPAVAANGAGAANPPAPSTSIGLKGALALANKMEAKGVDENTASMQLVALGASAGKEILEGIANLTTDQARQFDSWLGEQPQGATEADKAIPFVEVGDGNPPF